VKSFDPDFTEADYKNAVTDAVNGMNGTTEDQKLIVTTIIDNSGKPHAKSFAISNKGSQVFEIAFASNDTESEFEVKVEGSTALTSVTKKTSEKDGTTTIMIGAGDNESLGLVINFSGVDKAVFGKNETAVGTYSISFDTSNIKTALDRETIDILKGLKLEFSNSVSGSTATSSISFSATDLISLKLNMSVTLSDDVSKYKAPADFFDVEALGNGDMDKDTEQKLKDYANSVIDGVVKATSGTSIGDLVSGYANDFKGVVNVDKEAQKGIEELEDQVFDYYMEVNGWIRDCNVYSGPAYDAAYAYAERVYAFDDKLWDMMDTCTSDQLTALKAEFAGIAQGGASIKAALEAAAVANDSDNPGMSGNPDDDWGFDDDDWGFGDDER
ncbi:MAG: hypothetical protein K2J80_04365, partial [Oscillospiraceae bacterium]|nr:hypothetical protein [Oscillospiraceae bacterium]